MSVEELLAILSAPAVRAIAAFLAVAVVGWIVSSLIVRRAGASAKGRRVRKALRTPLRIASVALGLAAATTVLGANADARPELAMYARVAAVLAIGLALTKLGELWLIRRMAALDIEAEDNLAARQSATRLGILRRVWAVFFTVITIIAALTVVPQFRSLGISLFASAGVAGLVLGIAAGPVLTNLFAGIQVAITQPIRIEDAVVVEGEWGWIEEIGLFHVVIRIWDWRRLVVPLSYFVNTPFQNWTRQTAAIIGSVTWRLDYTAPVAAIREEVERVVREHPLWDGQVVVLQVIETSERTMELRALMSAKNSPLAWDLRCDVREKIIAWLQENHPGCLPKIRIEDAPGIADQPHAKDPPPAAIVRDPSLREGPKDGGRS